MRDAACAALLAGVPRGDGERAAALALRLARVGDVLVQAVLSAGTVGVEQRVTERVADGRPFAVIAVEVEGGERLLAAGADGAPGALRAAGSAIRGAAAPHEVVAGEEDWRLWVLAPADGAGPIATRVGEAVATAAVLDGAPLRAAAGVATWPGDGADAAALLACADERLFAARAAGAPLR